MREHMFVYVEHPSSTIERVKELCAQDLPLTTISRLTGVARGTIRRWRARGFTRPTKSAGGWLLGRSYVYILGMYLGDGSLVLPGRCRTHTLDIACDALYSSIINEATQALEHVFPHAPVRRTQEQNTRCLRLRITHPALLSAFPQHGPGRKHARTIELVAWQRVLTHRYPEALIRGLIHSDGSRCINRFDTRLPSGRLAHYEYVRYFFTNYSEDIRGIFCEHCDLLGIRWTRSNPRNISIAHRDSVATLDEIVGPKA